MTAVDGGADNLTTERGKNQPVFGEAEPATVRPRAESDVFLSDSLLPVEYPLDLILRSRLSDMLCDPVYY